MAENEQEGAGVQVRHYGCIWTYAWAKKCYKIVCNKVGSAGCMKDPDCPAYRNSIIEQLNPDPQKQDSI